MHTKVQSAVDALSNMRATTPADDAALRESIRLLTLFGNWQASFAAFMAAQTRSRDVLEFTRLDEKSYGQLYQEHSAAMDAIKKEFE